MAGDQRTPTDFDRSPGGKAAGGKQSNNCGQVKSPPKKLNGASRKMPTKIDEIDERLTKLEREQLVIDTKQDEQIKSLFESVKVLRNVVYTFALLMLLALIYGALGPTGFNAVTHKAAPLPKPSHDSLSYAIPPINDLEKWTHGNA